MTQVGQGRLRVCCARQASIRLRPCTPPPPTPRAHGCCRLRRCRRPARRLPSRRHPSLHNGAKCISSYGASARRGRGGMAAWRAPHRAVLPLARRLHAGVPRRGPHLRVRCSPTRAPPDTKFASCAGIKSAVQQLTV